MCSPGNVAYDLKVKLKETAPPGFIKDQLVLVTNDQQVPTFPIEVEGLVVPEITVNPLINFGSLEVGGKTTKTLVVKGQRPFKITNIICEDERFSFRLPDEGADAKLLYTVPVTFTADGDPGIVRQKFIIETDRSNLPFRPSLPVPKSDQTRLHRRCLRRRPYLPTLTMSLHERAVET